METENQNNIELGALHEQEKLLIFAIRNKYPYADIHILTRNGLPYRLRIVDRFEDLSIKNDNSE